MSNTERSGEEADYPVRVAARMTGLTPELLRAWETRHGAIRPQRTAGGSRLYSTDDLGRLNLLREVIEAGHRIGKVAQLSRVDLEALLPAVDGPGMDLVSRTLEAAIRLDAAEVSRLLETERARLGPVPFAIQVALPLLREVGDRWARGLLGISAEHLVSAAVRSLILPMMEYQPEGQAAERVVFATPSGETHDLGTLIALQVYCPSLGPEVTVPISCAAGISTSLALESTLLALGKDKMPARVAVRTAFNMSFISMLAMELAENAVEISLTGGTFESAASFLALVPATAAGFFAAYPYNFYMLRRHGRSCH